MSKTVFCQKLQREAEGFEKPPCAGALGERILQHISKQAYAAWKQHQTMLINEYRLNLAEQQARRFLKEEMEKFLFGEGSDKPPGYQDPSI